MTSHRPTLTDALKAGQQLRVSPEYKDDSADVAFQKICLKLFFGIDVKGSR